MKNHKLKYQAGRRIAALKKMCATVLACVLNFGRKDTPVLMANNNYNISFGNTAKAMAVAASMQIVAVPIQDVQLLDYAVAHETVNATYGMTASTDDDMYLGLMDKDPYTSDQQRERDEYQLDDENWNEVVFEEVQGGSTAKLALHNDWIEKQSYEIDAVVNLDLPEQGISGPFRITSIKHIIPQKKPVDDDEADEYGYKPVTGLFIHEASDVWKIKFDNGEELGVTHKHPIYSATKGDWELAGELEVGEEVLTKSGGAKVVSKEIGKVQEVYNLEVKDYHNFLVNASGIVVHNTGNCFDIVDDFIAKNPILKQIGISRRYPGRSKDFDQTIAKVKKVCDKFGKVALCYDDLGFPDFSGFTPIIDGVSAFVEIPDLDGSDSDFDKANSYLSQKLGLTETKSFQGSNGYGFTGKDGIQYSWHHHQDGKTMVLVPFEIHKRTAHKGGADILKKLKEKGKGLFPSFKDINKYLTKCL